MPPTPPSGPLLYLDDLAVGQRYSSTGTYRIEAEDIVAFARAYDPQPFHLDPEAARTTIFGGLAASGWQTAAITMRLTVEGSLPVAGGLVGGGGEISWPIPTRPGDVLRVSTEILDVRASRSKPDRGIVTFRSETLNQRDEVVQVFTGKIVVPRRPA